MNPKICEICLSSSPLLDPVPFDPVKSRSATGVVCSIVGLVYIAMAYNRYKVARTTARFIPGRPWFVYLLPIVMTNLLQFGCWPSNLTLKVFDHFDIRIYSAGPPVTPDAANFFSLLEPREVRKLQLLALQQQWCNYSDERAHPVLSMLDAQCLCIPICLPNATSIKRRIKEAGPGASQYCFGRRLFRTYFEKDYMPAGSRANPRVLVGMPVHSPQDKLEVISFIQQVASLKGIPSKYRTTADLVVFTALTSWRVPSARFLLRYFRRVTHVQQPKAKTKLQQQKAAQFHAALRYADEQGTYDYMLWLEPGIRPIRNFWLEQFINEAYDASPFLVKGPAVGRMDKIVRIQSLFGFVPTQRFMSMHRTAIYGLWHKGFSQILQQLLGVALLQPGAEVDHNQLLFAFMLHKPCHVKFFLRYIRYSRFIQVDPVNLDNDSHETYLVNVSHSTNVAGWVRPNLGDCFSQGKLTYYRNQSCPIIQNLAGLQRGFLGSQHSWPSKCYESTASSKIYNASSLRRLEMSSKPGAHIKILVTVPFATKQWMQVLYALHRWQMNDFTPCLDKPKQFSASLLLLHSGLAKDRLPDLVLENTIGNLKAVNHCFTRWQYQFVQLEYDDKAAGTIEMFRQMTLGPAAQQHDYAFQMEADVLPIQKNWLSKVHMETQDAAPFWVKGSSGWYRDADFVGGCLTGMPLSSSQMIEMTPLGPSIFHINGNALYSLSRTFTSKLEHFLNEWSRQQCVSCPCKPQHSLPGTLLDCTGNMCKGWYDFALMMYFSSDAERFQDMLPFYRHSDFILNRLSPRDYPICIPDNTFFIHTWPHGISGVKRLSGRCLSKTVHVSFLRELEFYGSYGFPSFAGELTGEKMQMLIHHLASLAKFVHQSLS